ncbi:MAG: glycosyltransferase [Candidatus Omnitrophota bacterium]|jgi:glycosyltransferase involved in cell wall biosynthesis|nr:MAG: glycosyltransferase [Candidatus Omnitrophota bacterium]
MKIMQVVHGYPPLNRGGTEVYTSLLSRELSKRHRVFVFYRLNNLGLKEYETVRTTKDGLTLIGINNTFRLCSSFESTYRNVEIAEKFDCLLDEIKPDVVHLQHMLYLGAAIAEKAKIRNIPIVCTLHDYWLLCAQGQFFRKNLYACDYRGNNLCPDCVRFHLIIGTHAFRLYYFARNNLSEPVFAYAKNAYLALHRMFRSPTQDICAIMKRSDYMKQAMEGIVQFICPSQFLMNIFAQAGVSKEKMMHIPYGFDLQKFKTGKKSTSDVIRFGFIGNLIPAKGLDVLVRAFRRLNAGKAKLFVYGTQAAYKSILGDYIRKVKDSLKQDANIIFKGEFDNEDIVELLQGIDVLVVPSLWLENSPLVIQEAFAAGVPVIASDIGGIPELVQHKKNGILVEPGNSNSLREAMDEVVKNPLALEELKKNIVAPEGIEANAKRIETIYERILKR